MQQRIGTITRNTKETQITLTINLDGSGKADIFTGIGFFDHMLNSFARHGLFDLTVKATGDLEVDCHHTIEDVGIVLGQAIAQAVGDKSLFAAMETAFFLWMKHLFSAQLIYQADHIWAMKHQFHQSAWEDLIQRWQKNFSMLFHIQHQ